MTEERIFGPPGTGKTTNLTRIATTVAAQDGGGSVMICSYTNAAAEEIASRCTSIQTENVGTLHKACYSAMGTPPILESKSSSVMEWNAYAPEYRLSAPSVRTTDSVMEMSNDITNGDRLHAATTILRNKLTPIELWPKNAARFYEAWRRWKRSAGGIDFTDMLEDALASDQCAPGRPQTIIVDEAQDCTALQLAVIRKWALQAKRLVLSGDDDQCIYQFAGAAPEAFADKSIPSNDTVLEQSYRVPYNPWEFASSWIAKVRTRVPKDYMPKHSDDPGFVTHAPCSFMDGDQIVQTIQTVLDKGLSSMVIGSCSYMVETAKHALRNAGIPFHNPYRLIRGDWNPLKLTAGTTYAERVSSFLAPLDSVKPMWSADQLKAATSVLKADGVFRKGMKNKLDDISSVSLDMMFEYFTEEAVNRLMACDLVWYEAHLVNDEARRKAKYAITIVNNLGTAFLDASQIPPDVIIGTIHSVKGGESDVVIVIPDLSPQGFYEWNGSGRDNIRRLMYVALTRAKKGVIILRPATSSACMV